MRDRLNALIRDVTRAAESAETDQKLLADLVDVRAAQGDDPKGSATDAAYADAFREAGMNFAARPPSRRRRVSEPGPPRCG